MRNRTFRGQEPCMLRNCVFMMKIFSLLFVALIFGVVSGCDQAKKPESVPAEAVPQETSSYMVESLSDQVLREVRESPDNPAAWYHLADLYYRGSQYEKSIEAYKKVVELDPEKGYAYSKMGVALSQLGRLEEAMAALQKAVELLPNPAVEYNNLGIVFGKLGRYDEEVAALLKSIELRPRSSSARVNLGVTYLRLNKIDEAKEQYEALDKMDGRAAEILKKEINKIHPVQSGGQQ